MNAHKPSWPNNIRATTNKLALWTLAWLISFAVASLGPKLLWNNIPSITVAALVISIITGLAMIYANRAHLQSLDELQQKIQLNAMAATLGIGLVVGVPSLTVLSQAWIINDDSVLSYLLILMSITYLAANYHGIRKYK